MSDSEPEADLISIPLNDALKALGVTEFTQSDDLFTISFEDSDDTNTRRFGLEKTRSKTLENFTENAGAFKLDPTKIGKFKEIFMTEEYEQFFRSISNKMERLNQM